MLFFSFVIVFIASCNNYETFTITSAEYTTNQKYEIEFIKTFGTPSPNQEWGFTETTNESIAKTRSTKTLTRAEQSIQGNIRIIDEAFFRWNTRKAFRLGRFSDMFGKSIGLVKPNREFVLCEKVA